MGQIAVAATRRTLVAHQLGQPEIENLGVAVSRKKDVRGLDVAMDDAFGMRSDERVGNLDGDVEKLVEFHGLAAETLLQTLAFQLLHDDERVAVVVVNLVDGADVGVVQLRGSACFTLEPLERLAIVDEGVRDELEGHVAAKTSVFRLVHDSHAAATEFSHNFVVGDRLADHRSSRSFRLNVRPAKPSGQQSLLSIKAGQLLPPFRDRDRPRSPPTPGCGCNRRPSASRVPCG